MFDETELLTWVVTCFQISLSFGENCWAVKSLFAVSVYYTMGCAMVLCRMETSQNC